MLVPIVWRMQRTVNPTKWEGPCQIDIRGKDVWLTFPDEPDFEEFPVCTDHYEHVGVYYGRTGFTSVLSRDHCNLDEISNCDDRSYWIYGSADNLDQILAHCQKYVDHPNRYFLIDICEVTNENQGWRWHKNGPYIGTQSPQCEFIRDEPIVQKVIAFELVEVRPNYDPYNTRIETWFERDRAFVGLYFEDVLLCAWWDEAVGEAIEDGFLTGFRGMLPLDTEKLHTSALAYYLGNVYPDTLVEMHGVQDDWEPIPEVEKHAPDCECPDCMPGLVDSESGGYERTQGY